MIAKICKSLLYILYAVFVVVSVPAYADSDTYWTVSSEKEYVFESDMAISIAYRFLTEEMQLNSAAASGVIANMVAESGIRTTAMGDNGTSYGLCQWHNERWDKLSQYASFYGKPMEDIETQLHFFMDEMVSDYPELYQRLLEVDDSELGAYRAGYIMSKCYERPLSAEAAAESRGAAGASLYIQNRKEYEYSDTTLKILYMLTIYQNSDIAPKVMVNGTAISPAAADTYFPGYSDGCMTYDGNYWESVGDADEIWPEWIQTEDIDSFDPKTPTFFGPTASSIEQDTENILQFPESN